MAPKSRSKRGNRSLKNSDNNVENQVQESKNGVQDTDLPKNQTGTLNDQEVRIGFFILFFFLINDYSHNFSNYTFCRMEMKPVLKVPTREKLSTSLTKKVILILMLMNRLHWLIQLKVWH